MLFLSIFFTVEMLNFEPLYSILMQLSSGVAAKTSQMQIQTHLYALWNGELYVEY